MTKLKKIPTKTNEECFTYTVSQIVKNVSIVTAILAQFVWIIWKAAQLESRVSVLEDAYRKIDGVNIRQEMMAKQLDRLEAKIDRLMSEGQEK